MIDANGLQSIVDQSATSLLSIYDRAKAAIAVSNDLGLTMDADHTAAGATLVAFVQFIEGIAVAADANRRKSLNKVRTNGLVGPVL